MKPTKDAENMPTEAHDRGLVHVKKEAPKKKNQRTIAKTMAYLRAILQSKALQDFFFPTSFRQICVVVFKEPIICMHMYVV